MRLRNYLLAGVLATSALGGVGIAGKKYLEDYFLKEKVSFHERNPDMNIDDMNVVIDSRRKLFANYSKGLRDLYDEFGIEGEMPGVEFKVSHSNGSSWVCGDGVYLPDRHSIEFNLGCTGDAAQRYLERGISHSSLQIDADYILRHEGAHAMFYSMVPEESIWRRVRQIDDERRARCLVLEGFAEYVTYQSPRLSHLSQNIDLPDSVDINGSNYFYDCYSVGLALVKPILDRDFKRGLEVLIENPITFEDTKDLPRYQNRLLTLMEE